MSELYEYLAKRGKRVAFVTVSQRGTWSFKEPPDPKWPGSSSSCSSYSQFTREDALACERLSIPVERFDKAPSRLAIVVAVSGPMPTTGPDADTTPWRVEGEAPRWGGLQRIAYMRRLAILQACGVPVDWNQGIEFRSPVLDEVDLATVAYLRERAASPPSPPPTPEPVEELPFESDEAILREAALEGVVECRGCGSSLEPDCSRCGECGWKNPLLAAGFI